MNNPESNSSNPGPARQADDDALLGPTAQPVGGAQGGASAMGAKKQFDQLKQRIEKQIYKSIDLQSVGDLSQDELRTEIKRGIETILQNSGEVISASQRKQLVGAILDDMLGYGPLEPLLRDPSISDILINGPRMVFVERDGELEEVSVRFRDNDHLLQIIQRIANRVGRRVDENAPMVDARLEDGSRFNAIIPPLAIDGCCVSIRRFGSKPMQAEDLYRFKSATPEMIELLRICVQGRMNIVVSGGTGSGKTTLLNLLSSAIQPKHRITTIEDAAELQLRQRHVVRLETRPTNVEGTGAVTQRDLLKNALRMRPDRILIGECRGGEALDMLQAMNTGHNGSMTTIHANSPKHALSRLELLVGMAGFDLPTKVIRQQIAEAVQIIVQSARLAGGVRKITHVSEITGIQGEEIQVQDLMVFRQTGLNSHGHATGHFEICGNVPVCFDQLVAAGCSISEDMFEARQIPFAEIPTLAVE